MKIGSAVFFIFLISLCVLIGMGYVTSELKTARMLIQDKQAQIDQLNQNQADLNAKLAAAENQNQALQRQIQAKLQELENMQKSNQTLQAELQTLREKTQQQEKIIQQLYLTLNAEVQKKQEALQQVKQLTEELQARVNPINALLGSTQLALPPQYATLGLVIFLGSTAFSSLGWLSSRQHGARKPPAAGSNNEVYVRMTRKQAARFAQMQRKG